MELEFKDPIKVFQSWYELRLKTNVKEPASMTLSTVNKSGQPCSRIVLLKKISNDELYFYTNYNSDKSQHLIQNNKCSLNFHWFEPTHRQVRIEGEAHRASREDSKDYFSSRTRGSQIGAWASLQSSQADSREVIEQRVKDFEQKFKGQEIPCPPHWGGFIVIPHLIEFWQQGDNRLHDRFSFSKPPQGKWQSQRLFP